MLAVVWRSERLHLLVCDIRWRGPQALEFPPNVATEGSGGGLNKYGKPRSMQIAVISVETSVPGSTRRARITQGHGPSRAPGGGAPRS
jgi:hypothetical protein